MGVHVVSHARVELCFGCAQQSQSEKENFQWLHEHPTVTRIADISRLDYSINRTVFSWKLNDDVYQDNVREFLVLNEVKNWQSKIVRLSEKKTYLIL
jgi:hypothetical protein